MGNDHGEGEKIMFLRPHRRVRRPVDWRHWIITLLVGGVTGFIVSYVFDVREPDIIPFPCQGDQVQFQADAKGGTKCVDVDDFIKWWEDGIPIIYHG